MSFITFSNRGYATFIYSYVHNNSKLDQIFRVDRLDRYENDYIFIMYTH